MSNQIGMEMEDLRALSNCEAFKQIRIGLTTYHSIMKPLNSFNYISGNDQHIKDIAEVVLNVLLEHDLVVEEKNSDKEEEHLEVKVNPTADLDKLRGLLMYLLLNTSMGNNEKEQQLAASNPQFVHLLQQLPEPLTQVVTVSIALLCSLHDFLFEFLAYGPTWLTSQYFDCLSSVLGHYVDNKIEVLSYIAGALNAVTNALSYRYSLPIIDNSLALLQRHMLFSDERLRSALPNSSRRNRYLGKAMCMLLDVLIQILNSLKNLPQTPGYASIYQMHSIPINADNVPLPTAQQQLELFGSKLMDSIELLLQLVSVDTYLSWHEMHSDHAFFHLQAQVSNKCLKVNQLLTAGQNEHQVLFTHSLNSMLSLFVDGAQDIEQCLSGLNLGELLSLLDGDSGEATDEELSKALDELLSRSICFGSTECIESMAKHLRLLNAKHLDLMLNHLGQVVQMRKAERDLMEEDQPMEAAPKADIKIKCKLEQDDGEQAEATEAAKQPKEEKETHDNAQVHLNQEEEEIPYNRADADEQSDSELMDIDLPREVEEAAASNESTSSEETMDDNAQYGELINLVVRVYQSLTETREKLHLLQKRDELELQQYFKFYQPENMSRRTYFYNQLDQWGNNFPINEFLDLCFEQPEETWLAFAEIAMKHPRFFLLYLSVLKRCQPHSLLYMEATVKSLLNDPQLTSGNTGVRYGTASTQLLMCLYEQPIMLQSNNMPVTTMIVHQNRLPFRKCQQTFLTNLTEALAKFTAGRHFRAVEKTLIVLTQLNAVECQLVKTAKELFEAKRHHLNMMSKVRSTTLNRLRRRARQQLQLAKGQLMIYNAFHNYRKNNWGIIAQVVITMDQLRESLESFNLRRISALDLAMKYYVKYGASLITGNAGMRERLRLLIAEKVEHKHFWKDEELALLMPEKRTISEYTRLLGGSSTLESIQLLRCAIRQNLDTDVLHSFVEHVDELNSPKAQHAYGFVFKCYMEVLHCELIKHADPRDYPLLIEHILRTPRIRNQKNMLAAVPNLKILLRPSGIQRKSMILQYVTECLDSTNHN